VYYAYVEDYLNNGTIAGYKLQVTFNALCGDGIISGSETCDDANTTAGDGCGANCRVETGFTCMGMPISTCMAICGDGLIRGAEGCDDMNTGNGDGCDDMCNVEPGFTCMNEPSVCM
jgi:cysteine-rich repeat protein